MDPRSEEANNDPSKDESQETKTNELVGGNDQARNRKKVVAGLTNGQDSESVGDSIIVMESNQDSSQTTSSEVEKRAKADKEKSGMWSKLKRFFSPNAKTQAANREADEHVDRSTVVAIRPQFSQTDNQQETDLFLSGLHKKKMMANGLLDFAFLTANVNQLHNTIALGGDNASVIVLISISIVLQVSVSLLLIFTAYIQSTSSITETNNRPDVQAAQHIKKMIWFNRIDHLTITLLLIIAILNIFIAAFGASQSPSSTTTTPPTPS